MYQIFGSSEPKQPKAYGSKAPIPPTLSPFFRISHIHSLTSTNIIAKQSLNCQA